MQEWINARRRELKAQRDQLIANVNAADGALQMLDAMQNEINKIPPPDDKAPE